MVRGWGRASCLPTRRPTCDETRQHNELILTIPYCRSARAELGSGLKIKQATVWPTTAVLVTGLSRGPAASRETRGGRVVGGDGGGGGEG